MSTPHKERVNQALGALENEERLLLVLTRVERLSHAEVAKVLGIPVDEVKLKLQEAEKHLSEGLPGNSTLQA